MIDRLEQLLNDHKTLYGIICRDPTPVDIEQMAQLGYCVVWIDMEHSPIDLAEAARLCQLVSSFGMIPLVRIIELTRAQVQSSLDNGAGIVLLPDIRNADEAARLVELGKYPPLGRRGVATSCAGVNYTLGDDPLQALRDANSATHLMVQIESDEGMENLDQILAVDGVDMLTIGPADWAVTLGVFGADAKPLIDPRIEKVLTAASGAGKIIAMGAATAQQAQAYVELGARLIFIGVDIALKRAMLKDQLQQFLQA